MDATTHADADVELDPTPIDDIAFEVHRKSLIAACRRMVGLVVGLLPTFAVVALIMDPYAERANLRLWTIGGATLSALTALLTVSQWARIPKLSSRSLVRVMGVPIGVPLVAQWGFAAAVLRPASEHGALALAMLVFFAASATLGAVGGVDNRLSVALGFGIIAPNTAVFAVDHGLGAVPIALMLYGTVLIVAASIIGRRELLRREHLIAKSKRLLRDVSSDRRDLAAANAQLRHRATHDLLTGTANRGLLEHELDLALTAADWIDETGDRGRVGLLFLDLDRFKFVNDTMGHHAGDDLLVMVAERIKSAVSREDALVARVGGDEFVVLLRCLTSDDHLGLVADRLLSKFVDPFTIDGVEVGIGTSIGMAENVVGEGADDLYRHADAALYAAKSRGRGCAVFAGRELRARRSARINTERALRAALERGDIEAWLQPEVDLVSGEVVAAEALARWRMGDEVVSAGSFIDVAQRAGLLGQLTIEMFDRVIEWQLESGSTLPVGLNISPTELPALLDRSARVATVKPLTGFRLEIGVTDVVRDLSGIDELFRRARRMGAEIVLDDFGNAFSSMDMLSELSIDGLKIDGSYVARIDSDERVRLLIAGLAEFARSCDIAVIAEGVETSSQAEFLMQVGVDRAQGLLYSPAVDPVRFDVLARNGCCPPHLVAQF